jgi:hypothetical protein
MPCATAWVHGIFELWALRGASLQSTMYSTPIFYNACQGYNGAKPFYEKNIVADSNACLNQRV